MKTPIIELSLIESEILDIIENQEDFTTSDLQGCIQAQVLKAYLLGKNENKARGITTKNFRIAI